MEEAAGTILFHDAPEGRRFLLLRNRRHGTWGFPKGKLETGEDHATAARRELAEETGVVDATFVPDFETQSIYVPKRRDGDDDADDDGKKRVVYFLGSVTSPAFRRSDEHDAGGWMSPEEVVAMLQFEDLRRVFREALRRLRRV
ncbi:MAG TPA: NUDIX domain-containing protein [Planctomycetota bacterium]|nr:NUDIX domain-containing protein [Planctomycetota bacterium]